MPHPAFAAFRDALPSPETIRAGIIGDGIPVPGPFGPHPLVYADYVASGRALMQVEDFMRDQVLPWYANTHTETSHCGAVTTALREAARAEIALGTGATAEHAVIFAGSGATAGLNRLVHLLGVDQAVARGTRPVVILGPYEHHSNLLPWRESGAEVIELTESPTGGPDLHHLRQILDQTEGRALRIGAFSAASNVTGILTDTVAVTRMLRARGVLCVWDYACAAPYTAIDMAPGTDHAKDAVVFSAHKFLGGPGASGVLVLRRDAIRATTPSQPGGGTVRFVSPWGQDYAQDPVAREEAGTPNILGDIRAGLAMAVKRAAGQAFLDRRHAELTARARVAWAANPAIEVLGLPGADRLPIFSLRIRDPRGGWLHPHLVTRMLSDGWGIQARGGCACAGPYGHRLMGIDRARSDQLRGAILAGDETVKPGWTRLNLSAFLTEAKTDFLIGAVDSLARAPYPLADAYGIDPATAHVVLKADHAA
ncbi:MAG: aminotransferase class V-fold PLP-dependent enzyme [Rhodobacter sp.]|uniref:aminotransferase class V-fold PLP-dependent enzyme n=1 Tax=Pararhodobacter sp. TaxID=2127056 RepID=UPI001E0B82F6|nr:aminotransferase class V-fold PLP-dependent enzyme [Pararhodobacter sp.]MCB1344602.1 aminotransferase class V-fold PLP-dependent enzyme [Paracoccaceae bacterium]MCC0073077.1 aminotransferase class V-fold PLP-dependent enzyme [Rhodobacter sp.]HPD92807.1 aminotransferase class V-fold PLP-dependent enzyme [Pararhodobacter sp.]